MWNKYLSFRLHVRTFTCEVLPVFGKSLTSRFMVGTTMAIILIMSVNYMWDYREQRRQAFEELREKAQVITKQLLATMSHELRTPLTSIIAFTELLLNDTPAERVTERQNLEEIRNNGQNLLALINNLLDLAKIEAGRHQLKLETVDMVDLLRAG